MKYFFATFVLCLCINYSIGQNDTIIDKRTYKILEKYDNGNLKKIGQFGTGCLDETLRKHGYFISFDLDGNEMDKKLFFFDQERNRKKLGLKHGWWGWYGRTEKYFYGIRTKGPFMVDPCF